MSLVNLKQWVTEALENPGVYLYEGSPVSEISLNTLENYPSLRMEDYSVSFVYEGVIPMKEQVFEAILEGLSIYQEKLEGYLDEVIEYLEHQDTEG